jgi:excisionase family DNA binding protein
MTLTRAPAIARTPVVEVSAYLTVSEAALRLRVSEPTIRRWIARGHLPARRFGRTLRIPSQAVAGGRIAGDVTAGGRVRTA